MSVCRVFMRQKASSYIPLLPELVDRQACFEHHPRPLLKLRQTSPGRSPSLYATAIEANEPASFGVRILIRLLVTQRGLTKTSLRSSGMLKVFLRHQAVNLSHAESMWDSSKVSNRCGPCSYESTQQVNLCRYVVADQTTYQI